MSALIDNLQYKLKASSSGLALFIFKALSGLLLGLTIAIIGQEIIGYGTFSFTLVIVVVVGAVLRMARQWRWLAMGVFNLICVLLALLLRMYVLIAPGA